MVQTSSEKVIQAFGWPKVAAALGLPNQNGNFPVLSTCPLCGDTLRVYENASIHYHHCRGCGTSGDLVSLAEKVWQLPTNKALARLHRYQTKWSTETGHILKRAQQLRDGEAIAQKIWQEAKSPFVCRESLELRSLLVDTQLRLIPYEPTRWSDGMGKMVATIHVETVKDILKQYGRSVKGLFPGPGWGQLLVFSFYSLPAKLSSLIFVGRQGHLTKDVVSLNLSLAKRNGPAEQVSDPGYLGMQLAPRMPGNVIVASDDWFMVSQLHRTNFVNNLKPLPLIGWRMQDGYDAHVNLEGLDQREVVLWAKAPTPDVIRRALLVDAKLCLKWPDKPRSHEYAVKLVRGYAAHKFGTGIHKNAKPLTAAVRYWFAGRKHLLAESIKAWEELGLDCTAIIGRRRPRHALQLPGVRRVSVDEKWFLEASRSEGMNLLDIKNRCWCPLASAVIRFTRVVYDEERGSVTYLGEVLGSGWKTTFAADRSVVASSKSFSTFLESAVKRRTAGKLKMNRKRWQHWIPAILALHKPTVVCEPLPVALKRMRSRRKSRQEQ